MNWKGVSLHCQSRARTPTSTFSQSMKSASEEGKQSNQRKLAGHEHFYGWLRYNGYSLSGLSLMVWEEKWKVGNCWTSKPGPLTSSWQPQGTWTRDPYFELLKPKTLGLIPGGCYLPLSLCLASYHQMWQSQVEIKHYSAAYLLRSKHCSAELPLRAGLMCTALMHEYPISLRAYDPPPFMEVLCYSTSNVVKWWKK